MLFTLPCGTLVPQVILPGKNLYGTIGDSARYPIALEPAFNHKHLESPPHKGNRGAMNPMAQPIVADLLDTIIHDPDADFDLVKSRIPSLFGISDKATYLAYRSMGLKAGQALQAMGYMDTELLDMWREEDPKFLEWESRHIRDLQNTLASDMIKMGFMRNMAMLVAQDANVITKAAIGFDLLSKKEYDYFMAVRKHYSAGDLLALDKVLHPGDHRPEINITLSWGDQEVIEGVQAQYQIEGQDPDDYVSEPNRIDQVAQSSVPLRTLQSGD